MKTFKDFYILNEGRFRNSFTVSHIIDLPMFSIYVNLMDESMDFIMDDLTNDLFSDYTKSIFAEARNRIHKMGFPSMHANVIFKDLSNEENSITGGETSGMAYRRGKYMAIDYSILSNSSKMVDVIVHEWSHLWMYNNSQNFTNAVKQHYSYLLDSGKKDYFPSGESDMLHDIFSDEKKMDDVDSSGDLRGRDFTYIRKRMAELVKWVNSYGMSNEYELWATGVENFLKLPREHRDAILTLMRVTGSRTTPNRRMRKHKKIRRSKNMVDEYMRRFNAED